MKFKQLQELFWDIRQKLLSMNVEFKITSPAGGIPTAWEIHSKLFLEGANAQKFSDLYLKTKNAVLYIIWAYRRTLDLLKKPIVHLFMLTTFCFSECAHDLRDL